MNPRPKEGKATSPGKTSKPSETFNFFQGCNTTAQPEWGAEISRFKLTRRRVGRPKA
jgi:hypothetical protein